MGIGWIYDSLCVVSCKLDYTVKANTNVYQGTIYLLSGTRQLLGIVRTSLEISQKGRAYLIRVREMLCYVVRSKNRHWI